MAVFLDLENIALGAGEARFFMLNVPACVIVHLVLVCNQIHNIRK